VRKSHLTAAIAATLLLASLSVVRAQGPEPAARPQGAPPVALIDVKFIFKNHPRFAAMRQELKADVERVEGQARADSESIRKMREKLSDFRQGSPEFKDLEERIVQRTSELSARFELQRREFAEREAKIYYAVYQEIMQEVQYYCAAYGVAMVMNFDREKINPDKPEDVIRGVNREVVWYNAALDISDVILRRLAPQGNPNATANPQARVPGVYVPNQAVPR
jgi:Skp family chaperone for outer membrane proteins